ncbi:MAG: DUF996 domain-containing protein, partial [Candidatus Bathyarchaeia archaeon]
MHVCKPFVIENFKKAHFYTKEPMDFKLIKNLGGIGAVLLTIGIFFPILSLVGIVFVLLSLKGIGEYYNERCIFNYALYYVILSVIGIAVYAVLPIVLLKENPL